MEQSPTLVGDIIMLTWQQNSKNNAFPCYSVVLMLALSLRLSWRRWAWTTLQTPTVALKAALIFLCWRKAWNSPCQPFVIKMTYSHHLRWRGANLSTSIKPAIIWPHRDPSKSWTLWGRQITINSLAKHTVWWPKSLIFFGSHMADAGTDNNHIYIIIYIIITWKKEMKQ